MEILWPRLDLDSALNGLGKALHAARRALEPELSPRKSSQYLRLTDCMLSLNSERVVVDADRFQQLAQEAQRCRTVAAYESALAVYGGELLPEDRYEDWCEERRGLLSEMHVRVLLGLADALEEAGAYEEAADRLREALGEDRTREEVHRRLMRVYTRMGAPDRALRQYHLCQDVLRRELGLSPQPETLSVYRELLKDRHPSSADRMGETHAEPPGGPHRTAQRPFVGREHVLEALRHHLASAGKGQPGLILVGGEAGVGKTRLLSELAAEAGRDGATVLCGGASGASPRRLPYGPFAVALENYAAACSEAERNELARRHPGLARCLPSLPTRRRLAGAADDHLEFSASVARLLAELGRAQPVLLILGDLDESDPLSLDLLPYLAQLATTRPWLLVAALREEEAEAGTQLRQMVARLTRARLCVRIELQRLTRQHTAKLVSALLPGDPVDPELLERVHRQSRGNPMFIEELIHDARESGEVIRSGGRWHRSRCALERVPGSIRSMVTTRMEAEDETLRRVLALASAATETEISLSLLRAGAAALGVAVTESGLLDVVDRALVMGVLEEGEGGYTFRHPLVRSALYEDLPQHRRDQLRMALGYARSARPSRLRVAAAG